MCAPHSIIYSTYITKPAHCRYSYTVETGYDSLIWATILVLSACTGLNETVCADASLYVMTQPYAHLQPYNRLSGVLQCGIYMYTYP